METAVADRPAPQFDAFTAACPSRRLLDTIGDKWTSLVIVALGLGAGCATASCPRGSPG